MKAQFLDSAFYALCCSCESCCQVCLGPRVFLTVICMQMIVKPLMRVNATGPEQLIAFHQLKIRWHTVHHSQTLKKN